MRIFEIRFCFDPKIGGQVPARKTCRSNTFIQKRQHQAGQTLANKRHLTAPKALAAISSADGSSCQGSPGESSVQKTLKHGSGSSSNSFNC